MITDGSAIPAAKAAIVDLLSEAEWPAVTPAYVDNLPRPQISYGEPADRKRDAVIVGDTAGEPGDQEWFAFDASRRELFEFGVLIVSTVPKGTCQESVERAFAMFTVVARVIRSAALTTPKLGVDGIVQIDVRQPAHSEIQTAEGWICEIQTAVRVTAQIAP